MEEAIALAIGVQVTKLRKRIKRDREMVENAPKKPLHQLTDIREVLACLVAGVYHRDKYPNKPTDENWKSVGYEHVKDLSILADKYVDRSGENDNRVLDDHHRVVGDFEKDRLEVGDLADDPNVRLMLFRRIKERVQPTDDDNNGDPSEPNLKKFNKSEGKLPEFVIAIRGTIKSKSDDLLSDFEVFFETLHNKKRSYMPIVRLILAIYLHYHIADHVCVAGHSLGAALGLEATRFLALKHGQNFLPKTHLFNLPNVTADVLMKKGINGLVNGFFDSMKWIVGDGVTTSARNTGRKVADIIDNAVKDIFDALPIVGPKILDHKDARVDEANKLKLIGYAPYLYVNEQDFICNEYIKYFKPGYMLVPPSSSTTAPLGELSPLKRWRSRSNHMVPRAHLFINHRAEGPIEAHKLHQWFLYPTVDLEEYPAMLDEGEV